MQREWSQRGRIRRVVQESSRGNGVMQGRAKGGESCKGRGRKERGVVQIGGTMGWESLGEELREMSHARRGHRGRSVMQGGAEGRE